MSKLTKKSTTTPSGSLSISGGPTATYKNGKTSYSLTPDQQKAFDYAQKSFAEQLGSINVFSEDTQKQLNNQVNAYKQNALKELDALYAPMIKNVREDSAKRFGNLDNSVFMNNLYTVESNRADAMNNLVQDVSAKQNELINEELQNRYNYLNFINNYQNQILNNALSLAGLANSSANLNGQYMTQNAKMQSNNYNDLLGTIATIAKFL